MRDNNVSVRFCEGSDGTGGATVEMTLCGDGPRWMGAALAGALKLLKESHSPSCLAVLAAALVADDWQLGGTAASTPLGAAGCNLLDAAAVYLRSYEKKMDAACVSAEDEFHRTSQNAHIARSRAREKSIDEVGLGYVAGWLAEAGICTVGDVISRGRENIGDIRRIGALSLLRIDAMLESVGLEWIAPRDRIAAEVEKVSVVRKEPRSG